MAISMLPAAIRDWLAERRAAHRERAALADQFAALGPEQTERLLHDCGLSVADLPALRRRHPDVRHALGRLLGALGLDWRAVGPETMRDLGLACMSCRGWRRCRRELARGTAARHYAEFCPNAARIEAIRAVRPSPGS